MSPATDGVGLPTNAFTEYGAWLGTKAEIRQARLSDTVCQLCPFQRKMCLFKNIPKRCRGVVIKGGIEQNCVEQISACKRMLLPFGYQYRQIGRQRLVAGLADPRRRDSQTSGHFNRG